MESLLSMFVSVCEQRMEVNEGLRHFELSWRRLMLSHAELQASIDGVYLLSDLTFALFMRQISHTFAVQYHLSRQRFRLLIPIYISQVPLRYIQKHPAILPSAVK
jgi:hypothetical protein